MLLNKLYIKHVNIFFSYGSQTTTRQRMDDLFDQLQGATIFSKLDLWSGYLQTPIAIGDIENMAFCICYGHFEWLDLFFGLINAPASFISHINGLFWDLLDKYVIFFINDILVIIEPQ